MTCRLRTRAGPGPLADVKRPIGATAVDARDAVKGADVVVTIPQAKVPLLPKDLFVGVPASTVVIDIGNYYPQQRDGRIEGIEKGTPESRWIEQQIGRPVVKAFNNIYAAHLKNNGKPAGTKGRIVLPVGQRYTRETGRDEAHRRNRLRCRRCRQNRRRFLAPAARDARVIPPTSTQRA